MSRVVHFAAAATVVVTGFIWGCRNRGPAEPAKADLVTRREVVVAAPDPAPVVQITEPTVAPSPDAVVRQAETFVRDLNDATAAGPADRGLTTATMPPAPATATERHVSPRPTIDTAPTPSPANQATPSPGAEKPTSASPTAAGKPPAQAALLAKAVEGLGDDPMIVPEGTEFGDDDVSPTTITGTRGPSAAPDDLGRKLTIGLAEHPKDVSAHLDYQLYQFITGNAVPELAALASLPTEDRELMAAVMDGLSNFRSGVQAEPNALMSKRVRPLVQMGERLNGHAGLSVPVVRLCRRVDGFGAYAPIEPARFTVGGDGRMLVYAEVGNFASQLDPSGQWQTRLLHAITLYEESGRRVSAEKETSVADTSRTRRRDFFTIAHYRLPTDLPAGKYILKVRIRDEQSNQVAEAPAALEVVAAR